MDINDPKRIWDLDGTEDLSTWEHESVITRIDTVKGIALTMTWGGRKHFSTYRSGAYCPSPWWEVGDIKDVEIIISIPSDDFSEDEITSAMEFIQTG